MSKNPKLPMYRDLARLNDAGEPRWTGVVKFLPERLDQPLRTRKPSRIFVCDMSDLFHEKVTNEQIAAVFGVMAACPRHTFQVLTKRSKRMREWFKWVAEQGLELIDAVGETPGQGTSAEGSACAMAYNDTREIGQWLPASIYNRAPWPLPNVWLGVSVEDQKRADERIPDLLATPAAVRFLSLEPLLEPVDLSAFLDWRVIDGKVHVPPRKCQACNGVGPDGMRCSVCGKPGLAGAAIDWVIIGGESGPGSRPFDLKWARSLIKQCDAAGSAPFVQQLGSRPMDFLLDMGSEYGGPDVSGMRAVMLADKKGGNPEEWPAELRRREYPIARVA